MSYKGKVINVSNFKAKPDHVEKIIGKSMTVPGESWSVEELLSQFRNGALPSLVSDRTPVFDSEDHSFDDVDLEKARRLDLADQGELLESVRQNAEALEQELKAQEQEAVAPSAPDAVDSKDVNELAK